MKKFKSNLLFLSSLIGMTGACIGTSVYAYTSANADKLELLNRAVANDTLNELKQTRGDIKLAICKQGRSTATKDRFGGAVLDNKLYMWGDNEFGQLGIGWDRGDVYTPVLNTLLPAGTITQFALGWRHAGAVVDNKLYMWGYNNYGQLGLGAPCTGGDPDGFAITPLPTHVPGISGTITQLSLGNEYSGAVSDNRLYMWGNNNIGELGFGSQYGKYYVPTPNTGLPSGKITKFVIGYSHAGAVVNNQLYMWGTNSGGKLGTGDHKNRETPTFIDISGTITQLALGWDHTAVVSDNQLYTWGYNTHGELGHGNYVESYYKPTHVVEIQGKITQLALGLHYSAAVSDNKLYMWGANTFGQLGLGGYTGPSIFTNKPILVPNFTGAITQVVLSDCFSAAVMNNEAYAWGLGGALGIGDATNRQIPTFVNSVSSYDPSIPITLDATNDKDFLRNKLASDISNDELISLIRQSWYKFQFNFPSNAKIAFPNKPIPSDAIDVIGSGKITFNFTGSWYESGVQVNNSLKQFKDVIIQGFRSNDKPPVEPPIDPPVPPIDPPIPPIVDPIPPIVDPIPPVNPVETINDNTCLIVNLSLGIFALIIIFIIILLLWRRYNKSINASSDDES